MVVSRLGVECLDREEPGTLRNRKHRKVCVFWGRVHGGDEFKEREWSKAFYLADIRSSTFIHPAASESTGAGVRQERDEAKCFGKLQSLL